MSEKEEKKGRQKIITAVSWVVLIACFAFALPSYISYFKTISIDTVERIDATSKRGFVLTEARSIWGWSWFNRDKLSIDPNEFTIEKNSVLSGTQIFTIPHSKVKQVTFSEGYTCSTVSIVTEGGIIFPNREYFSIQSKEGYGLIKVTVEAMSNISNNKFIIVEKKTLLKRVLGNRG